MVSNSSSPSSKSCFITLLVLCIVVAHHTASSLEDQQRVIKGPGLGPQRTRSKSSDKVIKMCWSSLFTIDGCITQVYETLFKGEYMSNISPNCCEAVSYIREECWPRMFPYQPNFPDQLRDRCDKLN